MRAIRQRIVDSSQRNSTRDICAGDILDCGLLFLRLQISSLRKNEICQSPMRHKKGRWTYLETFQYLDEFRWLYALDTVVKSSLHD